MAEASTTGAPANALSSAVMMGGCPDSMLFVRGSGEGAVLSAETKAGSQYQWLANRDFDPQWSGPLDWGAKDHRRARRHLPVLFRRMGAPRESYPHWFEMYLPLLEW